MKKIIVLFFTIFCLSVSTINNDVYAMKRKRETDIPEAPASKRQKTNVTPPPTRWGNWFVTKMKNFFFGKQQPIKKQKAPEIIEIKDDTEDELSEEENLYQKALEYVRTLHNLKENAIATKVGDIKIYSKDIAKCMPMEWLSDNIIDGYIQLLKEKKLKDKEPFKYFFYPTTFYLNFQRYKKYPKDPQRVFGSIKRIKKKPAKNIFNFDKIIIPVNPSAQDNAHFGRTTGNHWVLFIINLKDKKFEYFNSLYNQSTGRNLLNLFKKFLKKKWLQKEGFDFTDENIVSQCSYADDFSIDFHPMAPQQENGYDCGVFTCKYAECCVMEKPLSFTQKDIPDFRKKICIDLMRGKWTPEKKKKEPEAITID